MSEAATNGASSSNQIKLPCLFAFKEGMSSVFTEAGEMIPVTVLKFQSWVVTQIKTMENDGYNAVQVSCEPKKSKNTNASEVGHFKKAGFGTGFKHVKEIRMDDVSAFKLGDMVALDSLTAGDVVKVTGSSKGKGFMGSVRRWSFAGGPASHGSKFHRQPGSSGNRTWPGRVMPGKKFPGHWGDETITVKNLKVVDVLTSDNAIFIKGAVPGAKGSLVKLVRE